MVTQEGTTITIPAHELATQGAHSVTMVTADGTDEQVSTTSVCTENGAASFKRSKWLIVRAAVELCRPQVAIMTPDMASFQTVEEAAAYNQDEVHPVTLFATSNGTHIAVQVGQSALPHAGLNEFWA